MKLSLNSLKSRSILAVAGAAVVLAPVAAHAATVVPVEYDAQGSSFVAKTNSTIALGPTKLNIALDVDTFDFTGSLPLPGTTTTFKIAGLIPVTADVDFIPAGPVTGHINLEGLNAEVTSTAKYFIRLSNVKAAGLPTFVGSTCKTASPVSIPANTPEGEGFDLTAGGTLQGTYTIGNFEHCGLTTALINTLVPGPGNTATVNVTNGVFL